MVMPSLANLSQDEWFSRMAAEAEEDGYLLSLGEHHSAILFERGENLLITFETLRHARMGNAQALPVAHELAERKGWSHLTILAHRPMWFRDPAVYAYFDRMVDDDFLEDFDQIVFFGEGMCGYGAAAYSVVAPGSTVISLSPQATLDPSRAGWDRRFLSQRRRCFTDRYGFAPDMLDGCEHAYILYDPEQEMDAMHASLFDAPHITRLRCRYLGGNLLSQFENMQILNRILIEAMEGNFNALKFWKMYRVGRQTHLPYLKHLKRELEDDGRSQLIDRLKGRRHRFPEGNPA